MSWIIKQNLLNEDWQIKYINSLYYALIVKIYKYNYNTKLIKNINF